MKVLIVRVKKTREIIASGVYVGRNEVVPFTEVFSHKEMVYQDYFKDYLRSNVDSFKRTFKTSNTVLQEVIL